MFTIHYASKTLMKITSVSKFSEADARQWFGKIPAWNDVVRVRMVNDETGDVVADQTVPHRLGDPENPDRELMIAELVERMDRVFVGERRFTWRKDLYPPVPPQTLTVNPSSSHVCWCGHTRIEHTGADSSGYCAAPNCPTKCQRFRLKR